MRKIMVLVILVSLLCVASITPRKGLVVNRIDGKVMVNTHITQQVKLGMWEQPRLSIKMEWDVDNKNEVTVLLSFMSLHSKQSFCPEFFIFDPGAGSWRPIGHVEYEKLGGKGGVAEIVHVSINIDILTQLALSKMPLRVRVCSTEIYLHAYEYEDLREAVEIWRRER